MGAIDRMIRPAVMADIPFLLPMIAAYRDEVRPDLSGHTATQLATLKQLIAHRRGCAMVLELDHICGVLLGQAAPSAWWPELTAEMMLWWVDPARRGSAGGAQLLTAFEDWARDAGAGFVGATYTGKSAAAYLGRRGYRHAEIRMMKDFG
ncbi:MAG: GNAT family N-acetyltransferase [Sulfitobacter sp.]